MPVALGGHDELLAAVEKLQLLLVDPRLVDVGQDALRRPRAARDEPEVEARLQPVRRLHGDRTVVRQPLHAEDVLVACGRLVHPGRLVAADLDDPELHGGVRVARLRVALRDDLRHRRRELRERDDVDHRLVRAQERDRGGVVRPPESGRGVVEDLFPVHPREGTVQDRGASVGRQLRLALRREVVDVEIVAPHEGHLAPVRRDPRNALGVGRLRQPLEPRRREVQHEEIAVERIHRDLPRRIEALRPGQRLRRVRRPDERLQARQRRRPIDSRRARAGPGLHPVDRPRRRRFRLVEDQEVPAGRPRELTASSSPPPPRRCRPTRR